MKIFTLVKVAGVSGIRSHVRHLTARIAEISKKFPGKYSKKSLVGETVASRVGNKSVNYARPSTYHLSKKFPKINTLKSVKYTSRKMDNLAKDMDSRFPVSENYANTLEKKLTPLLANKMRTSVKNFRQF